MTDESSAGAVAAHEEREALQLVHHHPGRLRVRADAFRGESDVVTRVRASIEAVPGIARFAHNARTGSLLVEYQPGLAEPDSLLARIADAAGLARYRADAVHPHGSAAMVAIEAARELNAIAYELTGWRADLRTAIPAGLAAFAAYSFAVTKEERLPRWDNLLYWSYNVFQQLHRREIDRSADIAERAEPEAGQGSARDKPST